MLFNLSLSSVPTVRWFISTNKPIQGYSNKQNNKLNNKSFKIYGWLRWSQDTETSRLVDNTSVADYSVAQGNEKLTLLISSGTLSPTMLRNNVNSTNLNTHIQKIQCHTIQWHLRVCPCRISGSHSGISLKTGQVI